MTIGDMASGNAIDHVFFDDKNLRVVPHVLIAATDLNASLNPILIDAVWTAMFLTDGWNKLATKFSYIKASAIDGLSFQESTQTVLRFDPDKSTTVEAALPVSDITVEIKLYINECAT